MILISTPSILAALGILLFYTQILFHWWNPESAFLLKVITGAGLVAGFSVLLYSSFFYFRRLKVGWEYWLTLSVFSSVVLFLSLKPGHLIQETDFLTYHFKLPKEWWTQGSWNPVAWTPYEFLSLTVQEAFSGYWIAWDNINRFPQFLFFGFLFLKITALAQEFFHTHFTGDRLTRFGFYTALIFFGCRGVAIQAGTAMLDLVNLYFLVSIVLSALLWFRTKPQKLWFYALFGIDLGFYLSHKSFSLFYFFVVLGCAEVSLRWFYKTSLLKYGNDLKAKQVCLILLPVVFIWLPGLVRSTYFTGDPFYPVFAQMTAKFCQNARLEDVGLSCEVLRDRIIGHHKNLIIYGYGHDPISFLKSLALVAIPEWRSVNNKFDYPLGLQWYLGFLFFGFLLRKKSVLTAPEKKIVKSLLFFALSFFVVWFIGSPQSRWLYPVLLALALALARVCLHFEQRWKFAVVLFICLPMLIGTTRAIRAQRWTLACFGQQCLDR